MRTLTHAEFLALRRFDALDGLRAIAAVIVIFFHYGGGKVVFLSGWIGVHIFFVVSGFLITTLMLREKDRTGRISLRNFYLRRIFRIVPLYYLGLAATALGVYHSGYSWNVLMNHLPHFLGFMSEYHLAGDTPYLHTWTIGIEQKFYLVWPLALILVGAISRKLRAPLAVAAIVLVLIRWSDTWHGMGIHYSVLLTGALLAVVLHHRRGYALFRPLTHPLTGVAVAAAFLVLHLHLRDLVKYFGGEQPAVFLYGLAVAVLLPSLFGPGPGRWVLSLRPLVFVGERSYGVYLLQALAVGVVAVLAPWLPGGTPLFATAVTLVALFAADGLYRWVEQPMIGNGRRLIKWLDRKFPTSRPATAEQPASEVTPDRRAPVAAG
ncbi:peptidoglycan/LPS O-acetylase OafA/YrhL [Kitasatospora gansuensis]|uniref:Peptidoglycan/LPS O-acetylase OafA/YrhL n=1 Tax=Kitasatospora gansuensis TaxID=258050 RepID=A0A7W7WHQ9_9ACTN|nr:acyltransferase [Kitasatospora gansuensis]MBB4948012.1 peptidoglycan/LPS O-acetylase OafA/YrhL [Kitasatospora gansuensis]